VSCGELIDADVAFSGIVQVHAVAAHVSGFDQQGAGQQPLDVEAPVLHVVSDAIADNRGGDTRSDAGQQSLRTAHHGNEAVRVGVPQVVQRRHSIL